MEAIAVVAGIVGLIWAGIIFLRGGLVGGCLAVLLAGMCFSVPFYKVELGPLPLTADRVLLVLLVGQYLVWRRWGWADPKPLGKPEIILLAFTAVMALSTFTSNWQSDNYRAVAWLIIYYLMPAVVYWIARQARWSQRAVVAVFGFFAIFGLYLAVTSVAEYFEAWWLVFPKYIVPTAGGDAEFVGRGRGPLLHPIGNGVVMAVCLAGMLFWWPRLNRPGRLLLIPLSLLFATGIYCTLTRSAWIGGMLTLALVIGLAIPWNWRLLLFGGGLLVAGLVGVTHWEQLVAFKRDKALGADKTAESVELRPIMAVIAWHMFLDRPLFGCGYSQYGVEHLNYLSDRSTDLPLERAGTIFRITWPSRC